jgi:hypothetical protein
LELGKIVNAKRTMSKKDGIKDAMFQKVGTNKMDQVEKRKKKNRAAAIYYRTL